MRLGYERIVNDKNIQISVEELDDPVIMLKVEGGEDISFEVSESSEEMDVQITPEIKEIIDAVHQAYNEANKCLF